MAGFSYMSVHWVSTEVTGTVPYVFLPPAVGLFPAAGSGSDPKPFWTAPLPTSIGFVDLEVLVDKPIITSAIVVRK